MSLRYDGKPVSWTSLLGSAHAGRSRMMTKRNRRQFLEESMLAAAAAAAVVAGADDVWPGLPEAGRSVNEQLGVAVVGARGRGNSHLGFYAGRRDTRVLYVCDVDSQVGSLRAEQVAKRQGGQRPVWVEDLRRALEDPRVDIVSVATPNHWHALSAIWAMQAGKDVYVEKPVSHNVQEGRRMVEAARRYQRICQAGLQARSNPGMLSAIEHVRCGKIGAVRIARGLCYKRRTPVCVTGSYPVPRHVNYNLWLGPAPAAPLTRPRFHHDWHWQWPYGNGELGNQGVHQLDLCRWGLSKPSISESVISFGGGFGGGELAHATNTLVTVHAYRDSSIVMEVRGLESRPLRGVRVGVIFEGTDGYVVMTSYHHGTAFDREGRVTEHFHGGGGSELHFANFLQAVRQRSCSHLNADIEEGHVSSALAHTSNISYRLGDTMSFTAAQQHLASLAGADDLIATLARTAQHLMDHGVDPHATALQMGQMLECDSRAETFRDNQKADCMLMRCYRRPFVVPAAGSV